MITRRTTKPAAPVRRSINAGTSITAGAKNRAAQKRPVMSATMQKLSPQKQAFVRQLQRNYKTAGAITAATNTSNIMARPDFLELLPMFVQQLLILDVYGSVAMNSRQQLIPYFKFIAENTKGETSKGTILSSPFVNRQGMDANFTGRVIKNEAVDASTLAYTPVLPGSVTITATDAAGAATKLVDNGNGELVDAQGAVKGTVSYAFGTIAGVGGTLSATYQYDNETVGPDAEGNYGAKMAKGYLNLDEINLKAEARELACYWSVYAAFAANKEYGTNIGDLAKDAAMSELAAEINEAGFQKLAEAASYKPQYNWDASPVLSGAVVPTDYLKMFKLKLMQAASSVYQETRLARPNKLVVGTNVSSFLRMMEDYNAEDVSDTVGPYKDGSFAGFDVYVDPNYDVNSWVMATRSNDIRRCTALFGEYMPITETGAIGLANASVQNGFCSMQAMEIVNPSNLVSGKIFGTF